MIHIESTIRCDNRAPFSMTWTGVDQASPEAETRDAGLVRHAAARELSLTGSQLVAGCACLLGATKLLLWALLKLWLSEP